MNDAFYNSLSKVASLLKVMSTVSIDINYLIVYCIEKIVCTVDFQLNEKLVAMTCSLFRQSRSHIAYNFEMKRLMVKCE